MTYWILYSSHALTLYTWKDFTPRDRQLVPFCLTTRAKDGRVLATATVTPVLECSWTATTLERALLDCASGRSVPGAARIDVHLASLRVACIELGVGPAPLVVLGGDMKVRPAFATAFQWLELAALELGTRDAPRWCLVDMALHVRLQRAGSEPTSLLTDSAPLRVMVPFIASPQQLLEVVLSRLDPHAWRYLQEHASGQDELCVLCVARGQDILRASRVGPDRWSVRSSFPIKDSVGSWVCLSGGPPPDRVPVTLAASCVNGDGTSRTVTAAASMDAAAALGLLEMCQACALAPAAVVALTDPEGPGMRSPGSVVALPDGRFYTDCAADAKLLEEWRRKLALALGLPPDAPHTRLACHWEAAARRAGKTVLITAEAPSPHVKRVVVGVPASVRAELRPSALVLRGLSLPDRFLAGADKLCAAALAEAHPAAFMQFLDLGGCSPELVAPASVQATTSGWFVTSNATDAAQIAEWANAVHKTLVCAGAYSTRLLLSHMDLVKAWAKAASPQCCVSVACC